MGTWSAIYDRIFKKKNDSKTDFRVTHGRGADFNEEMEANQIFKNDKDLNLYQTFGLDFSKKGFESEMPKIKAKKMDYTSNQDLDRYSKND